MCSYLLLNSTNSDGIYIREKRQVETLSACTILTGYKIKKKANLKSNTIHCLKAVSIFIHYKSKIMFDLVKYTFSFWSPCSTNRTWATSVFCNPNINRQKVRFLLNVSQQFEEKYEKVNMYNSVNSWYWYRVLNSKHSIENIKLSIIFFHLSTYL